MKPEPMDTSISGNDLVLICIPFIFSAVAVAYNLPEADGANQNLTLSREALVGIFNGTIQTWNHPLIQATNNFKVGCFPLYL